MRETDTPQSSNCTDEPAIWSTGNDDAGSISQNKQGFREAGDPCFVLIKKIVQLSQYQLVFCNVLLDVSPHYTESIQNPNVVVEGMRRQLNIYVVTMLLIGGLLATSVVLKVDGDATTHASLPSVSAQQVQNQTKLYVETRRG